MIASVKGTKDILPDEIGKWHLVENTARQVFELYGFEEIRTPIFEETELFARGIGQETDIVAKEMYTFVDKSGKSISLRPEATAPVVRAYIEHHLYRGGGISKLYYIGPMFRHERPQRGRLRQFHQIGAEVLGSDNPLVEVEVIELAHLFLRRLGVSGVKLLINSIGCPECRPLYIRNLRAEIEKKMDRFCAECQRRARTNTLRMLDCKSEACQPLIEQLPAIADYLCRSCSEHFAAFRRHLERRQIPYQLAPRLVRGLDYYVRTTFEMTSDLLGAQNAVAGGGRYDGLSEMLGGPPVKGFGFAMGIERLLALLPEEAAAKAAKRPQVFLAPIGQQAFEHCADLARRLRELGIRCYLDLDSRSLKSQMRLADKLQAKFVVIVGEDELKEGRYLIRRMSDGVQMSVESASIVESLRRLVAPASADGSPQREV